MSSTGIDFVIGGKDNAKPAMASVEKSLKRLEQNTGGLAASTKMLTKVTTGLALAYGALKAAAAGLRGLGAVNEAYDAQIDAVEGLESALQSQGVSVDLESARLQQFASDMQALTGVGDEVTIGLQKQAALLGVSADQLDDVSKATIGLSEATGRSLQESLKLTTQAIEGEFGAFGEVIPAIRSMQTEEEKLAAVLELSKRGLDAKVEASNTVAGMSERASGAIGDLMESVGALLAPVRVLINAGLKTMAEALQQVLGPAVEHATDLLENIGPMVEWVQKKVIAGVNLMVKAFTFFEVIIMNFDDVWQIMVSQAELYLIQMTEAVKHSLTVEAPAYAGWFAENFFNLIRDGFSLAYTVAKNHVSKIVDTLAALWDYLTSAGSTDVLGQLGEIAGRSYLEGFESSLTKLPEMATRKITERETQLAEQIGGIASKLGDEFATKFSERAVAFGDLVGDAVSTDVNLSTNSLGDAFGKGSAGASKNQELAVSESRLLTRGRASATRDELLQQILDQLKVVSKNTKGTTRMVPQI